MKSLIRREILNRIYFPIFNDDDTLDIDICKQTQIPELVIKDWQGIMERRGKEDLESWGNDHLFASDINKDVNNFLCKNKITKEDLHSIEVLKKRHLMDNNRAIIIYAGETECND